jgi:outer membrane protein OmpA-like peptidoglycan-associated protein
MGGSLILSALAALSLGQEEPEPLVEVCPMYNVFFDQGSAQLSPPAHATIDNWALVARQLEAPRTRYTIEAVAVDDPHSPEANLDLSWRRARAIVDYLTHRGFAPERFRIRARGQSDPPRTSPTVSAEQNRLQNYRATQLRGDDV